MSAPWEWQRQRLATILGIKVTEVDDLPAELAMQSLDIAAIEALVATWNNRIQDLTKDQYDLLSDYLFKPEGVEGQ